MPKPIFGGGDLREGGIGFGCQSLFSEWGRWVGGEQFQSVICYFKVSAAGMFTQKAKHYEGHF